MCLINSLCLTIQKNPIPNKLRVNSKIGLCIEIDFYWYEKPKNIKACDAIFIRRLRTLGQNCKFENSGETRTCRRVVLLSRTFLRPFKIGGTR